jgi:hypothetical protein
MQTSPRSLLRPLLIIVLIFAGIILLMWGLPTLMMLAFFRSDNGGRQIDLSEVSRSSHLQFPRGAHIAGAVRQDEGRGDKVLAKIIMTEKSLAEFKQKGFAGVIRNPPDFSSPKSALKDYPAFYGKQGKGKIPDWWTPGAVKGGEAAYIKVESRPGEATTDGWIAILIDRKKSKAEIYLSAAFQ